MNYTSLTLLWASTLAVLAAKRSQKCTSATYTFRVIVCFEVLKKKKRFFAASRSCVIESQHKGSTLASCLRRVRALFEKDKPVINVASCENA
jgi:hypothetical protein